MTIYVRPPSYPRWCELAQIGDVMHRTSCGAALRADEAFVLAATPPQEEVCIACRGNDDDDLGPDTAAIHAVLAEHEDLLDAATTAMNHDAVDVRALRPLGCV